MIITNTYHLHTQCLSVTIDHSWSVTWTDDTLILESSAATKDYWSDYLQFISNKIHLHTQNNVFCQICNKTIFSNRSTNQSVEWFICGYFPPDWFHVLVHKMSDFGETSFNFLIVLQRSFVRLINNLKPKIINL